MASTGWTYVVAALRAPTRGRTGDSYLIPGHRQSIREVGALASMCAERAWSPRTAPAWAVQACVPVATWLARHTGNPLLPTRETLHALTTFPVVDGGKARRELGYRPRPFEETLTDLYRYFVAAGLLAAPRLSIVDGVRVPGRAGPAPRYPETSLSART